MRRALILVLPLAPAVITSAALNASKSTFDDPNIGADRKALVCLQRPSLGDGRERAGEAATHP